MKEPSPIATGTVSSRGQLVIPQHMREELGFLEGSLVAFKPMGKSLIVRAIDMPDEGELIKEFESFAREAGAKAKARGISESNLDDFIHAARAKRHA